METPPRQHPQLRHAQSPSEPGFVPRLDDARRVAVRGLRDDVFRGMLDTSVLPPQRLAALRSWLAVLAERWPAADATTRRRFAALSSVAEAASMVECTAPQWRTRISVDFPVLSTAATAAQPWRTCQPSDAAKSHLRGYPCALWTLFHVVAASTASPGVSDADVLAALRALEGYIVQFFACEHCRRNFLAMRPGASELAALIAEAASSATAKLRRVPAVNSTASLARSAAKESGPGAAFSVWIWDMHNRVSVRLAVEEAAEPNRLDAEHRKSVWPPTRQCARCRRAGGEWDVAMVSAHLRAVYAGAVAPSVGGDLLSASAIGVGGAARMNDFDRVPFDMGGGVVLACIAFAALVALCVGRRRSRQGVQWRRCPPP